MEAASHAIGKTSPRHGTVLHTRADSKPPFCLVPGYPLARRSTATTVADHATKTKNRTRSCDKIRQLPLEAPMAIPAIQLLQNMPIFGGLNADTLDLLLRLSHSVVVPEGEFFFRQGDEGSSTFVLEHGRVSVVKLWGDEEHLLRSLGPGDCFGEMALIDFGLRSASVRADVESKAIELMPKSLLKVAKQDLEQHTLIYMNMARELSRRLREADERLFKAKIEQRIADDEFDFNSG